MKRLALMTIIATLIFFGYSQHASADAKKAKPKTIDVAICLDVSGSMQHLIESAKVKLWNIVNELAKMEPTPNLRVALYSYGRTNYDPKLGWVQKECDLTNDLDLLYQKLFALTTNGGTELVTRVCWDAVQQLKWSREKDALRMIFVAGNEPASQDKIVSLKQLAEIAKKADIFVNPVYCGNENHGDARDWKELAELAGGNFNSIDQKAGTIVVKTPFDKKLANLGDKLNTTYIAYGATGDMKARNQKEQSNNARKAGLGVQALRATVQNSKLYNCEAWDLVDRCKMDKKFELTKLSEDQLPKNMRKMTPKQRVAYVESMTKKRAAIQKQITELSKERAEYVRNYRKKNPDPAHQAFHEAILTTIRSQATQRGIAIPK